MRNKSLVLCRNTLGVVAVALVFSFNRGALAQNGGQKAGVRTRQERIAELKAKIANLQEQLRKTEAEGKTTNSEASQSSTSNGSGCCGGAASGGMSRNTHSSHHSAGAIAQAGAEPSPGGEHPMGGMGGMEGGMGGSGMMGSASASPAASPASESSAAQAASPSPDAMEEHMKGMEHMHGMMHGRGAGATPQGSPGGMPMEHGMGGGMSDDGMQGAVNTLLNHRPIRAAAWAAACQRTCSGRVVENSRSYSDFRHQFVDDLQLVRRRWQRGRNFTVGCASLAVVVLSGCAPAPTQAEYRASAGECEDSLRSSGDC
jgi:hypothetical protein